MQTQTVTVNANHTAVTRLKGFSFQEDSSAAAVIEFRKAAVGGTIIWYLNLAADQTGSITFTEALSAEGGVYIKEVSGSVAGVLYH